MKDRLKEPLGGNEINPGTMNEKPAMGNEITLK